MARRVPVYIERGPKRTFASAADWPGWSRGGRSEEDALESLGIYGPRYAEVMKRAKIAFDPPHDASEFEIVERGKGGSGTDFGVPSVTARGEKEPLTRQELERVAQILHAAWSAFDAAVRAATGKELRKGPRGGGRDLDKIVAHVVEAEEAYIRQLGSRFRRATEADATGEMRRLREQVVDTLRRKTLGEEIPDASAVKKPWLPRYAARRIAWHVLDHTWEIEDRRV